MKFIYVANIRLPTDRAHGYQIIKTCEALSRSGIDLELLVTNRRTPFSFDTHVHYGIAPTFAIKRLPVWDVLHERAGRLEAILFVVERWSFGRSLHAWYRANNGQDYIYYTRDAYVAELLKKWKAKVFLEIHAIPKAQHGTMGKMDGVACLTRWMEARVKKSYPNVRTAVIPDAVDIELFQPPQTQEEARLLLSLPSDQHIIVYGGRFSTMAEGKGLDMLDKAVSLLAQLDPLIHLYLVGGTAEEFYKIEGRLPLATTTCIPAVPRAQLALYYRAANVLVIPFPAMHHYAYEMSPLKLFEYMASGTPIVTTDLPAIRDVLDEQDAFFCQAGELQSLQQALHQALTSADAQVRAERLRGRVQYYSWNARAQHILALITA